MALARKKLSGKLSGKTFLRQLQDALNCQKIAGSNTKTNTHFSSFHNKKQRKNVRMSFFFFCEILFILVIPVRQANSFWDGHFCSVFLHCQEKKRKFLYLLTSAGEKRLLGPRQNGSGNSIRLCRIFRVFLYTIQYPHLFFMVKLFLHVCIEPQSTNRNDLAHGSNNDFSSVQKSQRVLEQEKNPKGIVKTFCGRRVQRAFESSMVRVTFVFCSSSYFSFPFLITKSRKKENVGLERLPIYQSVVFYFFDFRGFIFFCDKVFFAMYPKIVPKNQSNIDRKKQQKILSFSSAKQNAFQGRKQKEMESSKQQKLKIFRVLLFRRGVYETRRNSRNE